MKSMREAGKRLTKTPRGPGTPLHSQKWSTEAEGNRDGGGPSLLGSEPPWCNSNFHWRSDWEILRKLGRRTPKKREEEEAAAGPR